VDLRSATLQENFPFSGSPPHSQKISKVVIQKACPWDFFNGATQQDSFIGGLGGILYLSNSHFSFSCNIGLASNNFVRLFALKMILN